MLGTNVNRRIITIVRWVARVWSIPIFLFVLGNIVVPDPNVVKPVPLTDWIELNFYWIATLGLLLAWRWEGLGGAIAFAGILGHEAAFRIIRGQWFFPRFGIPVIFLGLPAILFLVSRILPRGKRELAGPAVR